MPRSITYLTDLPAGRPGQIADAGHAEPVDALACWCNRTRAKARARHGGETQELIPPHMFQVRFRPPSAARSSRARPCAASARDVTAKCYGATCRAAQASRQAEGRQEEMRQFGKVDIPQEAFIAALKVDV